MMIASYFSTNTPKPLMYLNNSPIKMVSQAVLLGVTVDENLTWSALIDALHRRICRKIGVLRRTMRQLTSASRRQFLISVIQPEPDFEYAAVAFVPSMSMSGKQRLLALWRKAVRCAAMTDWRADIAPLLVHLKINAIEHRWALQFALLVRRCHLQQPRRKYWTSYIEHRMDSQLAEKVLLSSHFGQKLEVARFLLAIEHL